MKTSVWYKVYAYLINKYFVRNKMVVKLIYTDNCIAVYKTLRNSKVVTTRLNDFVRDFSIVNY